jgi:hypothetical protein
VRVEVRRLKCRIREESGLCVLLFVSLDKPSATGFIDVVSIPIDQGRFESGGVAWMSLVAGGSSDSPKHRMNGPRGSDAAA